MLSKRLLITFLAILAFAGISFAAIAASSQVPEHEYGNLSNVLINGGYSADYAEGMVLFSNENDDGTLWLRNTKSGSERKITDEHVSFINVIGNKIYYVTSDAFKYYIVKSDLNSGREIITERETEISNLFVSKECMYYLCMDSVVQYRFSDGTESVILRNPEIKAFVPDEKGIYWFKEKPVMSMSSENRNCDGYEGTKEESINFDCFLYSSGKGTNAPANYAEAIDSSETDYSGLNSLALSVEVGDVKIPTDEFPVGSYFTDSGMPCTDHGTGVCGWENENLCNCKAFHNGISLKAVQCYGYARYIYYNCFDDIGLSDSNKSSNLGSLEKGTVTEESFKALIRQAKPGAHLRVQYIKANGYSVSTHSMIILDWNESGFSVCEANADGKCGVSVRKFDYSSFVSTLVSVNFLMMPDEYPGFTEETTNIFLPATPGDAEPIVSASAEASTETITSESEPETVVPTVNQTDFEVLFDFLSLVVRIFVDCFNFFIRIISSLI